MYKLIKVSLCKNNSFAVSIHCIYVAAPVLMLVFLFTDHNSLHPGRSHDALTNSVNG